MPTRDFTSIEFYTKLEDVADFLERLAHDAEALGVPALHLLARDAVESVWAVYDAAAGPARETLATPSGRSV